MNIQPGKGHHCETCGQFVKLYRRTIYAGMAVMLIQFYKKWSLTSQPYIHIRQAFGPREGSGNFAKLAYWGLIIPMAKDPDDTHKRTSGMWGMTPLGVCFVTKQESVAKYVYTYNMQVLDRGGPQVYITDCFKDKFHYGELMK